MPKRKKSSAAGGSECSRSKARRQNETSTERLERLEKQRRQTEQHRRQETSEERANRQASAQEREARRRSTESADVQLARQASDQERVARRRSTESADVRLARQASDQERVARRRSTESADVRLARQASDQEKVARRRSTESADVRLARQASDQERVARRRSTESADVRLARQASDQERVARRRSTESADVRLARQASDQEKVARRRSTESADVRLARQASDQERVARRRSTESADVRLARQASDQEKVARRRSTESADVRLARQASDQERVARRRSTELADVRLARQASAQEREARRRSTQSADVRLAGQARNRQAHIERRRAHIPRSKYVARRLDEVLDGREIVNYCNIGALFDPDTGEATGMICKDCHALKWKGEPKAMCCRSGKIKLHPLFDPNDGRLQIIQDLWKLDDPRSVLFRKNVVAFNNALSLASLKVNRITPKDGRWTPSVVIQGKVAVLYGPLRRSDGKPAVFGQLYVLDPDIADRELRLRCGTLYTGNRRISSGERQQMEELLEVLQTLMHNVNPYVADFKQAFELIDAQNPQTVKLKIDANKRPISEHERRFQPGYKEVSVVMDDQDCSKRHGHDIVLTLRGAGNELRSVPDTNRAVDAWRFPLFFPCGNDGWHYDLQRNQAEIDYALKLAAAQNEDESVQEQEQVGQEEQVGEEEPFISVSDEVVAVRRDSIEVGRDAVGDGPNLESHDHEDVERVAVEPAGETSDSGQQVTVIEIPNSTGRCTGRMFYSYHLQQRYPVEEHFNQLLFGSRLLQEYVCLAAAKIENQELGWIKHHQKELRADKYRNIVEDLHAHDALLAGQTTMVEGHAPADPRLGQLVLLPPSHTGSPRFLHKHYQDGLAIVRENDKPDLFITFTCNPQWPEITNSLLGSQQPHDRPDLIARVFLQKLKAFHAELIKGQAVGRVAGHLNVVEFQKRGLPHNHMLLILSQDSRLRTAEEVDVLITAELPPDPNTFPEGPRKEQATELLQLVLKHMVHSCSSNCRPEGHSNEKCTKGFPHNFCSETKWDESAYYPKYRRREGREVYDDKGKVIDNRWVVPYNPYFLLKYKAHINFECCVSVSSVKYLYKYVHKGGDRVMLADDLNEVEQYQNMRSIGASEACWRIMEFPITGRHPAVMALRIHLQDEQMIYFSEDTMRESVEEGPKPTELTAFFDYNKLHPETSIKYVDFPKTHVLSANSKTWKPRKQGCTIGRVHTVHPASGDIFYLRILLHHDHCKGKVSFNNLRNVGGTEYPTFKEACNALGLLQNDGEWNMALAEASMMQNAYQCRMLYLVILQFCHPTSPCILFETQHMEWTDDFKRSYTEATDDELRVMVLLDLEHRLQEGGRELKDYGLPCPTDEERGRIAELQQIYISNRYSVIMQEEQNFDFQATVEENERNVELLNEEQWAFYSEIKECSQEGQGGFFFLDARGGTGKTFCLNTILAGARTASGDKCIALAVASSGIAAILLSLGRTFHSRFKVPIKGVDEHVTFAIKPNDAVAKVINVAKLIVWDEGPMIHRHLLEGLNRTLQDITGCTALFGGKLLIIAGDFALTHALSADHLTQNMRIGNQPNLQDFDHYLERLGNGDLPIAEAPDWIELPEESTFKIDETSQETLFESLDQFTETIFPQIAAHFAATNWLVWVSERAILAPKNTEVDVINQRLVSNFPGTTIVRTSADTTVNVDDAVQFPLEFLNIQTPSGMPPHQLLLKEGIVIMLLRNLNPRKGLCNGTRLLIKSVSQLLLNCSIISGEHQGEEVLIPRIDLTVDEEDSPLKWKRRQFPVRPAFAMTINKSQGQTLQKVGVWLREPCFSHGQLYVASSRVGHPDRINYAMTKRDNGMTRNVVYHEALLSKE